MSVLWYPSKSFSIANFRHPVLKSWLRPCNSDSITLWSVWGVAASSDVSFHLFTTITLTGFPGNQINMQNYGGLSLVALHFNTHCTIREDKEISSQFPVSMYSQYESDIKEERKEKQI